jgi:hypothetical protein
MGAWGYEAYDNDDAGDFFTELTGSKDVTHVVKKALKNNSEHGTVRAAAHFLSIIKQYMKEPDLYAKHMGELIVRLEALLKDEAFFADWKEPAAAKRAVKKELKALLKCKFELSY